MSVIAALAGRGLTTVTFVDGDGAEHVVPVPPDIPPGEAAALALSKLEGWKRDGRAFYREPLRQKDEATDA